MKGIFIVGKEPGALAALSPVVQQLRRDNKVGIDNGYIDIVLTGASGGLDTPEKDAISKARDAGIPSISLLDFWSNYTARFADREGNLVYLPDVIAVMDELAVSEMVAEGFPLEKLVITGQPAFDCLAEKRKAFDFEKRRKVQNMYQFRPERKTIVFCSQPLSKLEYSYGYDEQQVLHLLIDALPKDVDLIIRPHPREDLADLAKFNNPPRVTVQRKEYVHDLLMAADLVVGMNSEILVEACYLGCVVLSIQPGICPEQDRLPTNRSGDSAPAYDARLIPGLLMALLDDNNIRIKILHQLGTLRTEFPEPAAPKVARLIYERLGLV